MRDWRGDRLPAEKRPPYPAGAVVRYADALGEVLLLVTGDDDGHPTSSQRCLVLWAEPGNFWADDAGAEHAWQFGFAEAKEERIT